MPANAPILVLEIKDKQHPAAQKRLVPQQPNGKINLTHPL